MPRPDAELSRFVVLALIADEARHGWAVSRELQPSGEVGRVWSLSRPLTYRAIDTLESEGLVRRGQPREGEGADRIVLTATPKGRRVLLEWLDAPTTHLRDVRTELLLKLILRERLGLPRKPFITSQRRTLLPLIESVASTSGSDVVTLWRRESAEATRRFLDALP